MLEQVLVGTDTFNEGFTKFNNNSLEQFVNFEYLNGNLVCTKENGSSIYISLPVDASNKIITEVGTLTVAFNGANFNCTVPPLQYLYNNVVGTISTSTVVNFTSNISTLERIDIIYVNGTTGGRQKRTGTPAPNPTMPILNSNEILVGAFLMYANIGGCKIIYSCFQLQMDRIIINNTQNISYIKDLNDVLITNVVDGQMLVWDANDEYWKNQTIQTGAGNVDYIRSNPTNITVGGYDAGTYPNEPDIRQTIDKILYKDYDPNISLSNVDYSYYEFGSFIPIHEFFYAINKVNSSATVSNRLVFHNNIQIANPINDSGILEITDLDWQGAFTVNYYHSHLINFEVSYWNYATQYFSLLVDFIPPVFYGSIDNALINSANILTLNKLVQLRGDKEFLYSPNEDRMVFCYPQSFGLLTDIRDDNYSVFGLFTRSNINIEMIDNTFRSYYIYKLNADATYQNYKIKFIY